MSTYFESREQAEASRSWRIVDAKDQVVGRLASQIASVLRGKDKPTFAPHNDCGDFVVVINAKDIKFTGNKLKSKVYRHHTGFAGGVKTIPTAKLFAEKPEQIIMKAVGRMLPKTPLGKKQLQKLKVYSGSEHPHQAQQPKPFLSKECCGS
ncbi:MAG: 50S ribosomal protein L13 [Deltaproteobacteria bacterium]|nr:50S ribosomal protein L13 [Deltaproteobacteria bacterium]